MSLKIRAENLILGHRPGKKTLGSLAELNLSHICTLLSAREGGPAIESISQKLDCEWIWLPIEGGSVETLSQLDLSRMIANLHAGLGEQTSPLIYLHCSAGIHRTGFFAYALLRYAGYTKDLAREALSDMREVTAKQVGEERLDVAEALISQF